MTGRTAPEAVQNFLDRIQRVVACMSPSVATVRGGYHPSIRPHRMTLGSGEYHRLGGDGNLALSIMVFYRVFESPEAHGWRITTTTYYYSFADESLQEVLAYHWHPTQRSYATYPHLHLEAGSMVGRDDVAGAHLPTGWVSLTDVIRLAITELGVIPRRDDWQDVLEEARTYEGYLRPL